MRSVCFSMFVLCACQAFAQTQSADAEAFYHLIPAFENNPIDLDLAGIMNAPGLEQDRLVDHAPDAVERGIDKVTASVRSVRSCRRSPA